MHDEDESAKKEKKIVLLRKRIEWKIGGAKLTAGGQRSVVGVPAVIARGAVEHGVV